MSTMRADVIDISHHNPVESFAKVRAAGVLGVIHKATQGVGNVDPTYRARRKQIEDAGLLHGAYHFNTGEPVKDQVGHFLEAAQPGPKTVMVLDFEDNRASNMSLAQAVEFLTELDRALGRPAWIYSGNRIKSAIGHADAATRTFLAGHKLWLCEYGPRARLVDDNARPLPWTKYTLWQFTGDGLGPQPHSIDGVPVHGLDINIYNGDPAELAANWA